MIRQIYVGMILIGYLILRTMVFKEFENSLHFKSYGCLFSKRAFSKNTGNTWH